jgi:acyl carrier protein
MNKEIVNSILGIARNVLKSLPENTNENMPFSAISNWTSLNHALIMNKVEQHYNIEFDLDELIEARTIGDICIMVERKMG